MHEVSRSITSYPDTKLMSYFWKSYFWKSLWEKTGTKLNLVYHPQMDGQTEVMNQSLKNLVKSLAKNKRKQWDMTLSQEEFAYNRSKNKTTQVSPFQIVYGQNPSEILNLAPIPRIGWLGIKANEMADQLWGVHE